MMKAKLYTATDLQEKLQTMAIDMVLKNRMMFARGSYSEAPIVLQTREDYTRDNSYAPDNVYFKLKRVSGNWSCENVKLVAYHSVYDNKSRKYNNTYLINDDKIYYQLCNLGYNKSIYTTDKKYIDHAKAIRKARCDMKRAIEARNKIAEDFKIVDKKLAERIKDRIEKETGKKIKDQTFTARKYTYSSGHTQYLVNYTYRKETKCLHLG